MKTYLWTALILSAATALPVRATNNDGNRDHTFLALVVAEQPGRDSSGAIGSAGAGCLVFDGGFIDGGDPISGDRAPTPAAVAAGISAALQARNLTVDNAQITANPGIVLTYHWGVLRKRHWRDISLSHLNSNLKARLSLVARYDTVRDLEQYILTDRAVQGSSRVVLDQPTYRDARQYAEDPRYFVIVTAYDFNALKRQQSTPLWRVKLSSQENVGYMADAVPAMAAASGTYFGQNLERVESAKIPKHPVTNSSSSSFTLTSDDAHGLDQTYVGQLLKQERTEFTGDDQVEWDETNWGRR